MTRQELMDLVQGLDSRTRQQIGIFLAVVLLVVIGLSAVNSRISALEKKRAAREVDIADMMRLKLRYQSANAGAQRLAARLSSTKPDDSPAKVIDEIGIKGKSIQIKPVKGDDLAGYVEDAADVKIEGLSSNEAANLIYRLEKGPRPVTVKKLFVKQRFDDASKVDVSMTIALIKPAPAGAQ